MLIDQQLALVVEDDVVVAPEEVKDQGLLAQVGLGEFVDVEGLLLYVGGQDVQIRAQHLF